MTMLPDIDETSWDLFSRERLQRDLQAKIDSFGLEHAINEKIAGAQSLLLGVPAAPAVPEPPPIPEPQAPPPPPAALPPEAFEPVAEPAPAPVPEPEPVAPPPALPDMGSPVQMPEAPPSLAGPSNAVRMPVTPPSVSRAPVTVPAPAPTPAPSLDRDWIGNALGAGLNAVQAAGGDVDTFARSFVGTLGTARDSMPDLVGGALTAAKQSGADIDQFAQNFHLPALPNPVAPSSSLPSAGGAMGSVGQGPLQDYARQAAQKAGIDPNLFVAQIQQESGFNPNAGSSAGARGVAQIVPKYHPGVDPSDPYASLDYAANLMSSHLKTYGGDYARALVAYNGGGGAVAQYDQGKPYQESKTYLERILGGTAGPTATVHDGLADKWHTSFDWNQTYTGDYRTGTPHRGVDLTPIKGGIGTSVEAFVPGTVTNISRDTGAGGLMVYVQDRDGLTHTYMHLAGAAPGLKVGDIVQRGQQIAQMGESGTEGSPHLHYEVRANAATGDPLNALIDPRPYISGGGGTKPFSISQPTSYQGASQLPTFTEADFGGPPRSSGASSNLEPAIPPMLDQQQNQTNAFASNATPPVVQAPPEPEQSPVDRLKSAFGDFIDSMSGGNKPSPAPPPMPDLAQSIERVQATAAPFGEARDALLQSNRDTLPAGLERAGDILGNTDVGRAIAENQANPPLAGVREQIANAPVLGGALGVARGEALLSDQEVLQSREAEPARQLLERMNAVEVAAGRAPAPVTDAEVARVVRAGMVSQAVAMTGQGFGRPTRAPRATGHAGLDEVYDMVRRQDQQPGRFAQARERVSSVLGLGGRTGDLDVQVADKFAYINQLTGRAKQAMGSSFTPDMDAEALVAGYAGRGARALQRVKEDIMPAVKLVEQNGDVDSLNVYRKLQRDIEVANLNGGLRDASAGVKSAADAQEALVAMEQHVGPERWAKIQQADNMLNEATARLLQDRVDVGLINPDLAEHLITTQPHFNPTVLLKYLDESHEGVSSGGAGFQVGGNLLKRLGQEGSADDTEQALRSLTRFFVQNDVLINRNNVARSIIKAAQADPTLVDEAGKPLVRRANPMQVVTGPEVAGPGGPASAPDNIASVMTRRFGDQPGQLSLYEDGQRVYYNIPKGLEQAAKSLDSQNMNGFMKVMQALNAPLRFGATAGSPPFLVTNALADAVTTYVREGAATAGRIPMGWWAAAKQNDLYKDYIRAGGGMESLYQRSAQDLDKLVQDSGGTLVRNQSDIARLTKDALKLKWITRAGEVIEQGPRLATFERHLARGESAEQAAMAGRRATVDFSRSGEAVRQANAFSLFLNARVQGQLNSARTLRDNPESRQRLAALATMTAGLYAYNRQFPEYWDVPRYIRDSNAVIMLPGSEKDPEGPGYKKLNYFAVPLREWSAFTSPLNYALAKIDQDHGDDAQVWAKEHTGLDIGEAAGTDPRSTGDFLKKYAAQFSPMAGEDIGAGAGALLPAPARSFPEVESNRRFFTGLPIVPEHMKDLQPSQQYDERTSLIGRKLGETLGISPKVFDFVINENFGGLGRTALGASDQVTNWATQAQGGKVPDDQSVPIIGGLASGVFKQYGGQQRADMYDKLEQMMGQWQEPIATAIRQMPEYQNTTRDDQDSMLRTAQIQLRETFADEIGIPRTTRDVGLSDKYAGVSDPQLEVKIDEAISKFNAWEKDPTINIKPTAEETALYGRYKDAWTPRYRIEKAIRDRRNAGIRKTVEERAAAIKP